MNSYDVPMKMYSVFALTSLAVAQLYHVTSVVFQAVTKAQTAPIVTVRLLTRVQEYLIIGDASL